MSLIINPYVFGGGAPAADPVGDFAAVGHTVFDLTAEGFADTTAIGTLTDQTGNSRNATQATASKKPTAQTVSGMKVARFDGTNDHLVTASWTAISQPNTAIVLAKYDNAMASNDFIFDGITATDRHLIFSTGSFKFFAGNILTGPTDDSNWHVFVAKFDTTTSALYLDGGAAAVSGHAGSQALTGLVVGGGYDFSNAWWDGDINYIGLYDGDLVTDDLTLLNSTCQALADRAGITWADIT